MSNFRELFLPSFCPFFSVLVVLINARTQAYAVR